MNPKLNIQFLDPKSLVPNPANPRDNDEAVDFVAESIKKFGFLVPVVVKGDMVYAGHTRLKAALQLGLEAIPVVQADHLDEKQLTEFMVADNKLAEIARWDYEKLSKLLEVQDLKSVVGFSDEEIGSLRGLLEMPKPMAPILEPTAHPTEQTKLVQLYLSIEDYDKFAVQLEKLMGKYKTDNVTDTILRCVDDAAR